MVKRIIRKKLQENKKGGDFLDAPFLCTGFLSNCL